MSIAIETEKMSQQDQVVPESFQEDLRRAIQVLKDGRCSEVFLFGSGAAGRIRERSDIDLAIRGCPPDDFFHLLGQLFWELDRPVDLVDLDAPDPFAQYLQKKGELVRID